MHSLCDGGVIEWTDVGWGKECWNRQPFRRKKKSGWIVLSSGTEKGTSSCSQTSQPFSNRRRKVLVFWKFFDLVCLFLTFRSKAPESVSLDSVQADTYLSRGCKRCKSFGREFILNFFVWIPRLDRLSILFRVLGEFTQASLLETHAKADGVYEFRKSFCDSLWRRRSGLLVDCVNGIVTISVVFPAEP